MAEDTRDELAELATERDLYREALYNAGRWVSAARESVTSQVPATVWEGLDRADSIISFALEQSPDE